MALTFNLWTGEPEVGLWCPKCNLPSGYKVPLYHANAAGIAHLASFSRCYDCESPL